MKRRGDSSLCVRTSTKEQTVESQIRDLQTSGTASREDKKGMKYCMTSYFCEPINSVICVQRLFYFCKLCFCDLNNFDSHVYRE